MNIYFIPARAGSKRVPGKNYCPIGSKPLISYSIDFAISVAKDSDIIVVSTDCPNIIDIASTYDDKLIIDRRSSDLASDSSRMIDVTTEFITRKGNLHSSDAFILLQPTTPFRDSSTLSLLLDQFYSYREASSIISVIDVDFFHPSKIGTLNPLGFFNPMIKNTEDNVDNKHKKPYYVISGSFYLSSIENLLRYQSFIGPNPLAVIEKNPYFVNIDNPIDLYLADFLSRRVV